MNTFSTVLFAFMSVVPLAHAYVPPSFFVVRQVARKHADLGNTKISNRVTFFKGGEVQEPGYKEVIDVHGNDRYTVGLYNTKKDFIAGTKRSLLQQKKSPLLGAVSYAQGSSVLFEVMQAQGFPLISEPSLYETKDSQNEALPYKVETNNVFSRFQNRTVIVLNGNGRSLTPPQLWVEKDSFLPQRLIYTPDGESESIDVRFGNYQIYKNSFLPKSVEVFRDGKIWAKIELVDVSPAGKAEEHLPRKSSDESIALEVDQFFKWIR